MNKWLKILFCSHRTEQRKVQGKYFTLIFWKCQKCGLNCNNDFDIHLEEKFKLNVLLSKIDNCYLNLKHE